MNRQKSINRICDLLALFVQQVKVHNAADSFDINRFSETVLIPILAETYDWRGLVNLNSEKGNYPGIDLGDEINRIALQISSNTGKDKVKDTLEKFFEYRQDEQFDRLIIYNITEKKPLRSGSDSTDVKKGKFSFSRKNDVWDYSDLLKKIKSLALDKIQIIERILEHEFAESNHAEKFSNYLNDLSRVVATDANFVTKENDSDSIILLGDNLYVTRKIEEKISYILKKQQSPLVLISGEAGRGKTSLLWNLFNLLRQESQNEAWFLKSTMLKSEKLWNEHFDVLQSVVARVTAKNKRPILLIDTIDLLLHDEASRDLLVLFLLKISEIDCAVVAACRPQELSKLSALIYRKITLRDYESGEFEEAVHKHVARFYSASARQEQHDHTRKILEAVARGLPVREVCTNPLTLRMLFAIYAPARVEDDINVFKLYKDYWSNRVEKDFRAGNPFFDASDIDGGDNLEETTAKIAIFMLAEGLPELKYKQLQSKFGNRNSIGREVDRLISRGIIRRSQDDSVTFFHQTFFEHSAARGLLIFFKERALSLLKNRLQSEPSDLFTAPIYEQALLLAEDDSPKLKAQANVNLLELFDNKNIFAVRSGLYVYSHRQSVSAQVDEAVAAILTNSDEATQIRFLELAPNTHASRLVNLFDNLDLIWANASERTKEHLLKLLARLAPRDYDSVKRFFQKHDLFGYARGIREYSNVARSLLQIIAAVAHHDAHWGWANLMEFCDISAQLNKGRDLAIAAINFLCEKAVLFNHSGIATKFEQDTSAVRFDEARDFGELSESYGNLWLTEWKANKFSVSQVYTDIEKVSAGIGLVARMKGFGKLIALGTKRDAEFVLSKYEAETDPYRRSMWREAVIPNWLSAKSNGNIEQPKTAASREILLFFLKNKISELNEEILANDKKSDAEMSDFVYSVMNSSISIVDLLKIVDPSSFLSADFWLRSDLLGPVLVHGIIAGHLGALKAAVILTDNPEPYWSRLAGIVGMKMVNRLHENEQLANIFFKIVIKAKDLRLILRMLESITGEVPPALVRHQDEISNFSWSLVIAPKNPSERKYGLLILDKLLKNGAKPHFEPAELISLLNQEKKNQQNLGKIASVIARLVSTRKFNLEKVIDELRIFAAGENEELRRAGTFALVKAVEESEQNVCDYIYGVLETVLVPPLNAERLTVLRPLIEKMLPQNAEAAADVLQKLLIAGSTLGNSGRNKIFGRLKPTARRIVKFSNIETRRKLLGLAPNLDRILASMAVDAICHESLFDLSPELNRIFEMEVPGEVKETIIKYRYTQEREFGGKEWSELYDILEKDQTFFQMKKSNVPKPFLF